MLVKKSDIFIVVKRPPDKIGYITTGKTAREYLKCPSLCKFDELFVETGCVVHLNKELGNITNPVKLIKVDYNSKADIWITRDDISMRLYTKRPRFDYAEHDKIWNIRWYIDDKYSIPLGKNINYLRDYYIQGFKIIV